MLHGTVIVCKNYLTASSNYGNSFAWPINLIYKLMSLMNMPIFRQFIIRGLVLILAVYVGSL
jgi:predicted ABC-type sugar transport system permease subunit